MPKGGTPKPKPKCLIEPNKKMTWIVKNELIHSGGRTNRLQRERVGRDSSYPPCKTTPGGKWLPLDRSAVDKAALNERVTERHMPLNPAISRAYMPLSPAFSQVKAACRGFCKKESLRMSTAIKNYHGANFDFLGLILKHVFDRTWPKC